MIRQFQWVGKALFQAGWNTSHSGNLSVRRGDRILITRTGSMLGFLRKEDLVEVPVEEDGKGTERASSELPVHRAVYRRTGAKAIVHCHPPYAMALSLHREFLDPIDVEGKHHLKRVPVLAGRDPRDSRRMADEIASLLEGHRVVLCRSHGIFSAGQNLEEAFHWSSCLEHSSKVLWLHFVLSSRPSGEGKDPLL